MLDPRLDLTVAASDELLLQGRGFDTYDTALAAGHRWRHNLMVAFARLGIPIDLGADDYVIPHEFIQEIEPPQWLQPFGIQVGDRVLTDLNTPRLLVFAGEPQPRILYARMGEATLIHHNQDALTEQIERIRSVPPSLPSDQEKLAYQLVHSHLREPWSEAGYLELVTALEALTTNGEKSPDIVEGIERLERVVSDWKSQDHLSPDIAAVLGNILREGKKQSARQSILKLVNRLEGTYAGLTPKRFADSAYQLRGKLVHGEAGDRRPTREDLEPVELRRLVLDVLAERD